MKRSIPSVLRLTAMASPCSMTTESSLMPSSISYEHIHRYSIRSSHLRPGGRAPTGSLLEVWSNSLFPTCCSRNETAVQWENIASRVCVAMTKPPVSLREMHLLVLSREQASYLARGRADTLDRGSFGTLHPTIYLAGKYVRRRTSSLFETRICTRLILQGAFHCSP